jgi:hypothetical protein
MCEGPPDPQCHMAWWLQVFNFEKYLKTGDSRLVKFNNNCGYVNNKETSQDTVQAFSHRTWHATDGKLLVVDVQVCAPCYLVHMHVTSSWPKD